MMLHMMAAQYLNVLLFLLIANTYPCILQSAAMMVRVADSGVPFAKSAV